MHDLIKIFHLCFTEVTNEHMELVTVYFLWGKKMQEGWDDWEDFLSRGKGFPSAELIEIPPNFSL